MPETKNEPTPKWTIEWIPATLETYVRDEYGVAIAKVFKRAEYADLIASAPKTKRERDDLLVALKWAILHSYDVAECDCKACVKVRALAAEQIFRAITILSGHPYHRV